MKKVPVVMPPAGDLGYILDECARDTPKTQQILLQRVGAFWGVHWQVVLRWLKVYQMATPFTTGPRGPYKDKQ